MGDRTTWNETCPECGAENGVEVYDAPSSLMWVRSCEECDWRDPRGYYEGRNNHIYLCTDEEARRLGYIMDCPGFKDRPCEYDSMSWWEKEHWGVCIMCHQIFTSALSKQEREALTKKENGDAKRSEASEET